MALPSPVQPCMRWKIKKTTKKTQSYLPGICHLVTKIDTFLNNLDTHRLILVITELYWIDYEGKVERGIVTEIGKDVDGFLKRVLLELGFE